MTYEIIKKQNHKTSEWSGGTTTQLLIYPKEAVYAERNFKWRLSSAKVEIEESTFTHLPGISRIIMILEGELTLNHEKHHNTVLKKFDQDSFSGDWTTKSYGKVTDFNLMMAESCSGKLESIDINRGESREIILENLQNEGCSMLTEVFYCVHGQVEVYENKGKSFKLNEGDVLSVNKNDEKSQDVFKFSSIGEKKSEIVRTTIYY
ncbi:HutD family protein [Clostridium sp. P21]|uniref:HutD family protein n=1 Tax=Clostridium muellerianum TaxID=2716538 RepID=A0A7Y0EHQ8_9CLOT|nr:HutD family protein [Clostridium muellerianum]NMM63699.1 HutD family protein [Clostridium muellerianum]